MRSPIADPPRLCEPLDVFDYVALDIIATAYLHPIERARKIIANELRIAASRGFMEGATETLAINNDVLERAANTARAK
jgi:hypothetical protein